MYNNLDVGNNNEAIHGEYQQCVPEVGIGNASLKPSYCLSFEELYKRIMKCGTSPDPLSPMKYGSSQAKPKLHTSHSQNSNQQHAVSLALCSITMHVGIAQEDFIYC